MTADSRKTDPVSWYWSSNCPSRVCLICNLHEFCEFLHDTGEIFNYSFLKVSESENCGVSAPRLRGVHAAACPGPAPEPRGRGGHRGRVGRHAAAHGRLQEVGNTKFCNWVDNASSENLLMYWRPYCSLSHLYAFPSGHKSESLSPVSLQSPTEWVHVIL